MILFSEYSDYFEGLAAKYKPIGHTDQDPRFALLDIDDILSTQRGKLDFTNPVMVLENPEGQLSWVHNQLSDRKFGAFHILKNVPRNDPEKKKAVMDECQTHGKAIIARMQYEKFSLHKDNSDSPYAQMLKFFDLNEVKYHKVGPLFNDCFGWRFEFEFARQSPLPFDSDDWTDFDEP